MSPRRRERRERIWRALFWRRIDARGMHPNRFQREWDRAVRKSGQVELTLSAACSIPRQVGRIVAVDHERGIITYSAESL